MERCFSPALRGPTPTLKEVGEMKEVFHQSLNNIRTGLSPAGIHQSLNNIRMNFNPGSFFATVPSIKEENSPNDQNNSSPDMLHKIPKAIPPRMSTMSPVRRMPSIVAQNDPNNYIESDMKPLGGLEEVKNEVDIDVTPHIKPEFQKPCHKEEDDDENYTTMLFNKKRGLCVSMIVLISLFMEFGIHVGFCTSLLIY